MFGFLTTNVSICSNNVGFCIENLGFCIENLGFCIENVGVLQLLGSMPVMFPIGLTVAAGAFLKTH